MKQKDIDKLNNYFSNKAGKEACLVNCIEEHDCLVIGLAGLGGDPVGISFYYTSYISGPIRWPSSQFECSLFEFDDGEIGVQLEDRKANFILRSYGPVRLGDTGEIIPRS